MMFKWLGLAVVLVGLSFTYQVNGDVKSEEPDTAQLVQDLSVSVFGAGTGIIKVTKDGQIWVLTAAHVVEHAKIKPNPDGKCKCCPTCSCGDKCMCTEEESCCECCDCPKGKSTVKFNKLKVLKVIMINGVKKDSYISEAEVVRYSDYEAGFDKPDVALLRVLDKDFYKPAYPTKFYLNRNLPKLATSVLHCGHRLVAPTRSLEPFDGTGPVTTGVISFFGKCDQLGEYDVVSAPAYYGSSGGPVCLQSDAKVFGILVRGFPDNLYYVTPMRLVHTWAARVGVEFVLDDRLRVPTDEELMAHPVSD